MAVKGFIIDGQEQLYHVDETLTEPGYPPDAQKTGEAISALSDSVEERTMFLSVNKYDPSAQTPSTISPHYYVNGVPYSSTQYDSSYNCTALIPVKAGTQYTIGLVPAVNDIVKPWSRATSGVFFYDANGAYISGTADQTFTTPANAAFIRFNYYIGGGVNLAALNAACMLVEGASLPAQYVAYLNESVKEAVERLAGRIGQSGGAINYVFDANGRGVTLISKFSATHDIAVGLRCKGGNLLFDFDSVGLIPNTAKAESDTLAGISYLIQTSGDWHAPFKMTAKNNGDGDNPASGYFTGGNHQYNNSESGSTATARTASLRFKADGYNVESGSGACSRFEMRWTNYVQGYNTTKADGSGREILQENHVIVFDGAAFESTVELIPLESVNVETWYGFQWISTPWKNTRYIGATNRALYDASSASSKSGDADCCHVSAYGDSARIEISVDSDYDLGNHALYSGDSAIMTRTYGKGYFNIISNHDLASGALYALRGRYCFKEA